MSRTDFTVLVTGAGGFIGHQLVGRLLTEPALAGARFTLCDLVLPEQQDDPRVRSVVGDFGDRAVLGRLLENAPDLVFHLAGVLGGAAEADPALARCINIDATLSLFDALRAPDAPPRVVFASSIAVFGPSKGERIDDATETRPTLVYGAQKRMMEIALDQMSARGWMDGIALRLPGVVARPGADARLKSAFLNSVFYAVARGEDMILPVPRDGTTWLLSVQACVEALLHAARVPAALLQDRRVFTLPAQRVQFGDLVEGLRRTFPDSASCIEFRPDPDITAQFGRQPELSTQGADALGFRHDGDLATLLARAMDRTSGRATEGRGSKWL